MNGGSSAPCSLVPLALPCYVHCLHRGGNRRVFRLPGAGGDHFHFTVEPSPVHIRCRLFCPSLGLSRFFRDFPDLSRDCPEIFLICPVPLSRLAIPGSPYRGQNWKIRKMTFLGSKNAFLGGPSWNHLDGLFGAFNSLL